MIKVPPLMRHMPWLVALVACLATIVNLNPYPLYLGVSLVFGMSIALMTLFFAGSWWGAVVAIPASLATVYLWGQPYSCLIFLLEALVLTLLINGRHGGPLLQKGHIIIVDFLFWLAIGGPLYYITHRYLIGLDHKDALTIAEKALLNGVINVLLAYIVYSAVALLRNRRRQEGATISIQALSLSTSYSLIAIVSLFITSNLSNNLSFTLAKQLHSDFLREASFITQVLSPKSSASQHSEVINYMKKWGAHFTWQSKEAPNSTFSSEENPRSIVGDDYTDATFATRISADAALLAKDPNTISLLMPNNIAERILLKRYTKGYWQGIVEMDNEIVTMTWSAEPQFKQLGLFYESMLNSLLYTFTAGIVISAISGFALDKEFTSVLRSKRTADPEQRLDEEIFLRLSPIQEVKDLANKVNERTAIIQDDRKKIQELNNIAQQQLSTAGEIQQCFLGSLRTSRERPDVSLFMRPAYNAGGDWYDAFDLDGKTFLVIADVCDKGVGAALFMSVFRSLIRYSAESLCAHESQGTEPLDKVISSVNDYMSTEHGDTSMFATVFLACVNNKSKRLDYILAGHEEPILLRSDGTVYHFEISGPAIGLFPFAHYSMGSTDFDTGSILVGYTDGVIDARDTEDLSYGHQRLMDLILKLKAADPELKACTITDQLVQELDRHMGDADQFDDITIAAAIL
jgi:serine phosphatase RsbU (regulator of sigma subunit)